MWQLQSYKRRFRTETPSYGWLDLLNLTLPQHHITSAPHCLNLKLHKPHTTSNSTSHYHVTWASLCPSPTWPQPHIHQLHISTSCYMRPHTWTPFNLVLHQHHITSTSRSTSHVFSTTATPHYLSSHRISHDRNLTWTQHHLTLRSRDLHIAWLYISIGWRWFQPHINSASHDLSPTLPQPQTQPRNT